MCAAGRWAGAGVLAALVLAGAALSAEPAGEPPWRRLLQGEDATKAEKLRQRIDATSAAGKWEEARRTAEELLRLRTEKQGKGHWETVDARWRLAALRKVEGAPAEKQRGYVESLPLWSKAGELEAGFRYGDALPLRQKLLRVCEEVLGKDHPDVAACHDSLAGNFQGQRAYARAEAAFRTAIAVSIEALGEEHPATAGSYAGLATACREQGKFAEAQEWGTKALVLYRNLLGEEHVATANGYNNLATTLNARGAYAGAEVGFRKALAIYRKALGDENPVTANGYNNLAANQNARGNYAEAEEGFRKALAIYRKLQGEDHPDVASAHHNLAANRRAQGKYAEAEEGFHRALEIRRKWFGEEHPLTAGSYNSLAVTQSARGKYVLAEDGYRKALGVYRKSLGEEHPETATTYNNLASNQNARGKYDLADSGFRKALAIRRAVFGEDHPQAVQSLLNLAGNHQDQGRFADAEAEAGRAADLFARTRLRVAATGLDRSSVSSNHSPLPLLAALLARNGKPALAWQRLEQYLGEGIRDDFAAKLRRPAEESRRQSQAAAHLRRLDAQLHQLATAPGGGEEQRKRREGLLGEQLKTLDELARLGQELEGKYGPAAGKALDAATLQAALPAGGAYLAWLDLQGQAEAADPSGDRWAVLLKKTGDPVWARLPGRGPGRAWAAEDEDLPRKLRQALVTGGEWGPLADRLHAQRLAPLARDLRDVRQLVVLPSWAMAGIPVEVIAEGRTVSYAPSASLFAGQKGRPRPRGNSLVALGDPVYRAPGRGEPPLPPGGALLAAVLPDSPAARSGLKTGDVLLAYGGAELNGPDDLQRAIAAAKNRAEVRVWRPDASADKARELTVLVPVGKLGVAVAPDPAPKALAARRKSEALLAARGGIDWQELPGTRYEVAALAKLFERGGQTLLMGSDASAAKLARLAADGTLGKARYVHLATHGEARFDKPLASRIILSRDRLKEGERGELSAEQVLTGWQLDCDLVTLSACQSGLGKYEHSEGFVGFAQALQLAGARSLCLSLWSVNDLSTALLMERFYQNLLGKREGLTGPLGKAEALAEAKQWLRTLPREEALRRAEAIGAGVARGPGAKELPRVKVPEGPKETPPYAHPFYWAGFVLVGDR